MMRRFVCILLIVINAPIVFAPSDVLDDGNTITKSQNDDFLEQLDEKLMRANRRKWARLKVWGDVLDTAGWCVSLPTLEGGAWLSRNAQQNVSVDDCGSEQDVKMDGNPPADGHAGGDVYIWARQSSGKKGAGPLAELTARECEVFSWLRAGKSDAEISVILGCAVRTVEKHVANLYQKLGVKNRVAAIFKDSHPNS